MKWMQLRSRRQLEFGGALTRWTLPVVIASAATPTFAQQSVLRASVAQNGSEGPRESTGAALSHDARFVAFESDSQRLTLRDANGLRDVFVRDTHAHTTQLVSADPTGRAVGGLSPRISDDGRWVAFVSGSPSVTAGDLNGQTDLFVRDTQLGVTRLASLRPSGGQLEFGVGPGQCDLSGNGQVVAFITLDRQSLPGDSELDADLFVRDLLTGASVCATLDFNGQPISAGAGIGAATPKLSRDGRYCAFAATFDSLAPGDTNGMLDVFVYDRVSAATTRVSVASSGAQGDGVSWAPSISADGRWVSFHSYSSGFAPGGGAGQSYLHDRTTGATELVSVNAFGVACFDGANPFVGAAISDDARWVAFQSASPELSVGGHGVYMRDRTLGVTTRVDGPMPGGVLDGEGGLPSLAGEGRWIAFTSYAQLVPGDTNGVGDVFLAATPANVPTSYCTAGVSSNGCAALLSVVGQPSIGATSPCSLALAQADGQASTHLFYGLSSLASAPLTWGAGAGFLCVKAPYARAVLAATSGSSGACDGSLSFDWSAYQLANPNALGQPFAPTLQLHVQAWVRDPASPKSSSLSNAIALPFTL